MSMEMLYKIIGTSRQAFAQWKQPSPNKKEISSEKEVLSLAREVREKFLPGSGSRVVFEFIQKNKDNPSIIKKQLNGWGRRRFEQLCMQNGIKIAARRYIPKTTERGDYVFPNMISGMELDDINQVWVTDICYIFGSHGKLVGYATSMIDLYSRRLLGLSFSRTMQSAETARDVLQQAIKTRGKAKIPGLIIHSDGGKQYIEKHFLKMRDDLGAVSSMAENCLENGFAEAFNDTLKNHILNFFCINSFEQLKAKESFIMKCYNEYKPHNGIKKETPIAFENKLLTLQSCQRTKLLVKVIE